MSTTTGMRAKRGRASVTIIATVTIERAVPHGTETDKHTVKGKCRPGDEVRAVEAQLRDVLASIRRTEELDHGTP
jgi:hypothetical protein